MVSFGLSYHLSINLDLLPAYCTEWLLQDQSVHPDPPYLHRPSVQPVELHRIDWIERQC